MSRNKYPEETVSKIIDVSLQLFMTKGYESTSIQDIIDSLGGLTKGAIYHHFKSKEEILEAVMRQMTTESKTILCALKEDTTKTGLAKLQALFKFPYQTNDFSLSFRTAPNYIENPKILSMQLQSIFVSIIPDYVKPFMDEGLLDGSIHTDYPQELAEVITLLGSLWLNPLLFRTQDTPEHMLNRILLFKQFTDALQIPLIEDTELEQFKQLINTNF